MFTSKSLLFTATLLLLACPLSASAGTSGKGGMETFSVDSDGKVEINGQAFVEGAKEKTEVRAEVVKAVDGPEGSVVLYLRPLEASKVNSHGKVEKLTVSAEPRPFVAEQAWKYFDAEMQPTSDAHFAAKVVMTYPVGIDAAAFEVSWNECEGLVTANYEGIPCNRNRGLSDEYVLFLKQNFLGCVNQGLSAAGLPSAVKAHIEHDGTVADQNHSRGSLHAAGRAVDIQSVQTTSSLGGTNSFDFRNTNTNHVLSSRCAPAGTANCKFYEGLRSCWNKIHVGRRCPSRSSGPIGTIGWEDKKHIAHHLHTSMPFCPSSNGYFITESK
ncbi:MAG TPA: hypothetical protein VIH99_08880 [Bdellovibrionota bacterium]|jgi:hypothetical protein